MMKLLTRCGVALLLLLLSSNLFAADLPKLVDIGADDVHDGKSV